MQKYALFVFNGEMMCFVHVLLNAIQMHERGLEARIVMEGASTRLLPELVKPDNPLPGSLQGQKSRGLSMASAGRARRRWARWPKPKHRGCRFLMICRDIPAWRATLPGGTH